jgi:hypothetical protein
MNGVSVMKSSTIRSICFLSLIALLISLVPSLSRGQEDEPFQKIYGKIIEYKGTRAAGEPVPGAEVYVEIEPNDEPMAFTNQTKTNSEGYFEVWQKAGDYRITVKASGYKKFTKVIEVSADKDLLMDIQLNPGEDTYDIELGPEVVTKTLRPGGSMVVKMTVKNTGNTTDSYNVSVKGDKLTWMSMGSTRSSSIGGPYSQSVSNLEDNGIADIEINVTIPEDAEPGNYTFTVTSRSYWSEGVSNEATLNIDIEPEDDEVAEEDDSSTPFLGISALLLSFVIGGGLRRKRKI